MPDFAVSPTGCCGNFFVVVVVVRNGNWSLVGPLHGRVLLVDWWCSWETGFCVVRGRLMGESRVLR